MQGLSDSHHFAWTGLDLLKQFTSTPVWSLQPNLFLQVPMEEDKYHYLMSYLICFFCGFFFFFFFFFFFLFFFFLCVGMKSL